jgi:hypothetical protein
MFHHVRYSACAVLFINGTGVDSGTEREDRRFSTGEQEERTAVRQSVLNDLLFKILIPIRVNRYRQESNEQ